MNLGTKSLGIAQNFSLACLEDNKANDYKIKAKYVGDNPAIKREVERVTAELKNAHPKASPAYNVYGECYAETQDSGFWRMRIVSRVKSANGSKVLFSSTSEEFRVKLNSLNFL